jgi:hypothetical protein
LTASQARHSARVIGWILGFSSMAPVSVALPRHVSQLEPASPTL